MAKKKINRKIIKKYIKSVFFMCNFQLSIKRVIAERYRSYFAQYCEILLWHDRQVPMHFWAGRCVMCQCMWHRFYHSTLRHFAWRQLTIQKLNHKPPVEFYEH